MDLIYSASAFGAFSGSLFTICFLLLLGIGNLILLWLVPSPRKKRRVANFIQAFLSLFLILVGFAISIATFNSYQNGDKTIQVKVTEKQENTVKCGEAYCTEYAVETTDGAKLYVFGLEIDTWDKIELDACYQFTYYPLKPLLADYLQQENQSQNLYETTGYITLIGKVNCE